ncbi:glycosyltransferase WbsX family protein [Butyrivibrio sp. FCS006]|uniref:glycosyltransferase WbsX family protein n=1 Tax=Butyrivibrio sp. FCS006 TaxID=1280684 RepID=UPI0003F8286B|nr:glycoside hydrolase family 99-like domain-containing protein [Butyrivibrio sp. FCS006]
MIKTIAMYLPQYHRTPENDEWWGEGFTDWVAVKGASPLFPGHEQPKIPFDENYYDLMDKHTMQWQAELMHEYGIDGMCIYHYWFKDGRQILEKPVENLLKWKDIDMPFCFCWANETWARSWSNISGTVNAWADNFEQGSKLDDNGVLLLQDYGGSAEWEKHFAYLLKFFCDDRYIKIDAKPVIVIYRVDDIDCISDMICLWRKLAKENGFPDIYVIGGECRSNLKGIIDGQLYRQPARTMVRLGGNKANGNSAPKRYDYEMFCDDLLRVQSEYDIMPYFCGITGFDSTPRKGKNGVVLEKNSPEIFGEMMYRLMEKSASYGSDIVFVNAWNEWGEGMYLEPDTKHKYRYLEELSQSKKAFQNSQKEKATQADGSKLLKDAYNEYRKLFDNYQRANKNIQILFKWMEHISNGESLSIFIESRGWKDFAIYGYGVLGKLLCTNLMNSGYKPAYIIENTTVQAMDDEIRIVSHSEALENVDGIIVTAVSDYEGIKDRLLEGGFSGSIISAKDIVL